MAANTLGALTKVNLYSNTKKWVTSQSNGLHQHSTQCQSCIKIDIDGDLLSSNQAGLGAMIRDEWGEPITVVGRQF